MGKRDTSTSTSCKRIQGLKYNEEEISHRTKYLKSRKSKGNRYIEEHQKSIREIEQIHTLQEDHNSNHTESPAPNYPCGHDGNNPGDQGRRKDDSLEFGNQANGPNKNNEDTVGSPQTLILNRSGYFGQLQDHDIRSPTRQMLQVPKIQSYRQLLPRKVRHLRLCGGHHRTKVCVEKRKANETVVLKCHNCKGDHCTVPDVHTARK